MNLLATCIGSVSITIIAGCAAAPSPLAPEWRGSIGAPSRGVLTGGTEVRPDAKGLRWLRRDERHWAVSRFARAIERAAAEVVRQNPGSTLYVGDLSTRTGGGPFSPHLSHRTGIDADLLFYVTTLDGAPVDSPGFVHFGSDGLALDEARGRWVRLDVPREWLLVKALVEDPEARVQWMFVSDVVQAMLIEWALARGDSAETIRRAQAVMLQPGRGGVHDDHIHVRTACTADEMVGGCQQSVPRRPWLDYELPPVGDRNEDLVLALLRPIDEPSAPAPSAELTK
ncbi:MAG TPA: penicillin-insensitive murein endopeptidase [Polyangiaceae bacterium]|nr:penicillin-insensitive murein endopeptidase [Polyangiaceae bacterium]